MPGYDHLTLQAGNQSLLKDLGSWSSGGLRAQLRHRGTELVWGLWGPLAALGALGTVS